MTRVGAAIAVVAALVAGCGTTAAAAAVSSGSEPPVGVAPGGGEAAALDVEPLGTCVSCTAVAGGRDGPSAHATAVRVLGRELSGGTGRGGSSQRDALAALPSNPVVDLAIASWETGTQLGPAPAAQSRAALLDAGVLPAGEDSTTGGLLTVAVLESFSDAGWSGSGSHGYAASNGADIGVDNGALVILLLHSQATSDNHDNADVASIDGQALGGSAGESSGMPLDVPGVAAVTLFAVRAGEGAGSAAVGSVDRLLDLPAPFAGVLTSAAGGVRARAAGIALPAPPARNAAGPAASTDAPRGALGVPATGGGVAGAWAVAVLAGLALTAVSLCRRRGR